MEASYQIHLDQKDRELLENIRASLGGIGEIYVESRAKSSICKFYVGSLKDLTVLIEHFDKYPLITQKRADYELFKKAVNLMIHKEHLNPEGLQKIVNIRASINNGLSDELNSAFPNTIPVTRPKVQLPETIDPNWLTGFVEGEGCFFIKKQKTDSASLRIVNPESPSHKLGFRVSLTFKITQHARDAELMKYLVSYLGCGRYYLALGRDHGDFIVERLLHINSKIIPFFDQYPLQGAKGLDYADFRKASPPRGGMQCALRAHRCCINCKQCSFNFRRVRANIQDKSGYEPRKI